jgi:hypothetical protein
MNIFIKYIILAYFGILYYCDGLQYESEYDSIAFKSDEIIQKITNNSILTRNQQCEAFYRNIVENEFVCVYPNKKDENKHMSESKFVIDSIKIIIDTLNDKNDINRFIDANTKDYNIIYRNYLIFYNKSISSIGNILENALKYLIDKFKVIYFKIYYYMQDKYTLDEVNEQIILPIPGKIRYFTNETIKKYDNCLDFLNSLESSVCFTTKITNILKI